MKSNHFLALVLAGSGLAIADLGAAGCGGSSGGEGTGGATVATTATASSTGGAATSGTGDATSGTGGTSGGHHSFLTATPIAVGAAPLTATLLDAGTADYYSFTGKKGERLVIKAQSQGLITTSGHDPNDPTVTDTVVTLYAVDMMTAWASDDDAWPRKSTDSTLFAELPVDGTYYLIVEDCNSYAATHGGVSCVPIDGVTKISVFDYSVQVADVLETKGSATATTPISYKVPTGGAPGQYGGLVLGGDFSASGDVHVFSFSPPADTKKDPAARTRASFYLQPTGNLNGDGSIARVTLIAKNIAGDVIARADQQNYAQGDNVVNGPLEFSFPVTLGSAYTIEVHNDGLTSDPAYNYYFIYHFEGPLNFGQPEMEANTIGVHTNDTGASAEVVTAPADSPSAYFLDGNLSDATDIDFYSMDVPSGATGLVWFKCEAARDGSGLVGFRAELFSDMTATMPIVALPTEVLPAQKDLYLNVAMPVPLPAGTTKTYLEISATALDSSNPPNTGNYYHCKVAFQ